MNAEDVNVWTALHDVVNGASLTITRTLDGAADVNAKDSFGKTALHYAMSIGIGRMLLDARADVNARDSDDKTPLHYATKIGMVRMLLDAESDPNAVDTSGRTVDIALIDQARKLS